MEQWSLPSDEKSTPRTICLARSKIKGFGGKRATSCTVEARAVLLGEKVIHSTSFSFFIFQNLGVPVGSGSRYPGFPAGFPTPLTDDQRHKRRQCRRIYLYAVSLCVTKNGQSKALYYYKQYAYTSKTVPKDLQHRSLCATREPSS